MHTRRRRTEMKKRGFVQCTDRANTQEEEEEREERMQNIYRRGLKKEGDGQLLDLIDAPGSKGYEREFTITPPQCLVLVAN